MHSLIKDFNRNKFNVIQFFEEMNADYFLFSEDLFVAFGFNCYDLDDFSLNSIYWINPEIRQTIFHFTMKYDGNVPCFIVLKNKIVYYPHAFRMDVVKGVLFEQADELIESICLVRTELLKKIEFQRIKVEKEKFYESQIHFNNDQKQTINTIIKKVEEFNFNGCKMNLDYYVFKTIRAVLILYPGKNSPLDNEVRWYYINKEKIGIDKFEAIEFRKQSEMDHHEIAKFLNFHNPSFKKNVSEDQFNQFLREEVDFESLRHVGL